MAAAKKWTGRLMTIVLVLLILLTLFFTATSLISGGSTKVFGYQLMTVLSGSMEPGIKTGSVIAVKPVTDAEGYEEGDVVTYRSADDPNTFITHRIQSVLQEGSGVAYVTKGDNNDTEDIAPVPADHVVGEYAHVTVPYLGYVLNFAKSKVGIVLMMIVPGVYLLIAQLVSVWKILSEPDDETALTAKETKELSS